MIEQEVLYERNMTGSYMKIEATESNTFDERMLFSGKISGILPAEQCFLNGKAWYWYNISGKQSLDTFCKVQEIGIVLIEKIIISICDEIDILEWNLLDLNCLLLSPEYIFINNINQEILFTVYPGSQEDLSIQFRDLMEYLLTKINHKDVRAVQAAYGIYEKTLDEAYDIMDIRDYIVMGRTEENEAQGEAQGGAQECVRERTQEEACGQRISVSGEAKRGVKAAGEAKKGTKAKATGETKRGTKEKKDVVRDEAVQNMSMEEWQDAAFSENRKSVFSDIMHILNEWKQSIQRVRKTTGLEDGMIQYNNTYRQQMEESWMKDAKQRSIQVAEQLDYRRNQSIAGSRWPDERDGVFESEAGQTTVLSERGDFVKGVLVYEGTDGLDNISLHQRNVQIGKLRSSDVCIPRNTISQFHAKITYKNGDYLLEDLNSTNGTYVNDKGLAYKEVRRLEMNDIVRFADVSYRFV